MKIVDKLDKQETERLEFQMTREIVKVITSFPKSAEGAAAALSALIHCSYALAKKMWGVDEALMAIKFALDVEAQKDKRDQS